MIKKKVFFLADSTVDLFNLYTYLKEKYEIKWVIYHKDIIKDLERKQVSPQKINFINALDFFNKNLLFRILKKIIKIFFGSIDKKILIYKIEKIDSVFKPDFWITDTGSILSRAKTNAPKCSFKHGIAYKNHFLGKNIFNYDYTFLPGYNHYNRILEFYGNKIDKKRLIVAGSYRLVPYIKKKELKENEKNELQEKLNLSKGKTNVLFAPTHDAFGKFRFLSKNFGNQFYAIQKISEFVNNQLDANFIFKLHHYQYGLLRNSELKKISKKKGNHIFNSGKEHQVEESANIHRLSDIIITDTSGVAAIGIFLGKKIIYLEPDPQYHNWKESDIKADLRPGFVCNNLEEIYSALKKYSSSENLFCNEKKKFLEEVFFKHNKDASEEISKSIQKIIDSL